MAGFLQGLGQAVSGGIRGWERATEWQREAAADKYAEEARNQNRETWAKKKRVEAKIKAGPGDILDDPDGEGGVEAPPPPPPPDPAQMAAAGAPAGATAAPAAMPAPAALPPIAAALPLTDTQKAAASVVPAAAGLPAPAGATAAPPAAGLPAPAGATAAPAAQPAPVDPLDEPVVAKDRIFGTPVPTTKRRTRQPNDFDKTMWAYDAYMEEGMTAEANDVVTAYSNKHAKVLEEADRRYEDGMNLFIATGGKDRSGLQRANEINPTSVDVDMQMDPSGSGRMAVGINARGTKAPGVFRGPDGETSQNPIYMDPREAMVLARGVGNGGTLAALGTIVELRGKVQGLLAQKQGMAVQLTQVAQNAYQLYQEAEKNAAATGGTAPDINTFMRGMTVPDQESFRAAVASGRSGPGLPGGTGGTGGTGGSGGFMDTLAQIESGDRNIPSAVDGDTAGPGTKSQGHFQITTPTWHDFAPKAGVDLKQYPNAMSAPRAVQAQVATVIPFGRFGPRTQQMMTAKYGPLDKKATIGALAAAHGGGGGGSASGGRGLPQVTSTETAPTGEWSGLQSKPDPRYATAVQYKSKPLLDAGVLREQANADQAGNAYRASAAKAAETAGKPLDAAAGEEAYNVGRYQYISTTLNNMAEGDRTLMTPILLPNARSVGTGKPPEAPTAEAMKSNPFAMYGEAQGVHDLREVLAMKDKPASEISPEQRKLRNQLHDLRTQSPGYHDKIMRAAQKAGPLRGDEGPNPRARAKKNMFAVDTPKAVSMMAGIMPYIGGRGQGLVASPDVRAKLKAFDELRALDPKFADLIERAARDKIGALGMVGLSAGMK